MVNEGPEVRGYHPTRPRSVKERRQRRRAHARGIALPAVAKGGAHE